MYATGIPSGMMVDAKTPRWGVALGTVLFAAGYYPIAQGQTDPIEQIHGTRLTYTSIQRRSRSVQFAFTLFVFLLHRSRQLFCIHCLHQSRRSQLPRGSRHRNSLSTLCIRLECLFLRHRRFGISPQHIQFPLPTRHRHCCFASCRFLLPSRPSHLIISVPPST